MRSRHIAIALALFAYDGLALGEYTLALLVALVMIVVGLARPRRGARLVAIYLGMSIATVGAVLVNQQIASARATRIVAALEAYNTTHGAFPEALTDLVPAYLTAVPIARYTVADNEFRYSHDAASDDGTLSYTLMTPFRRRLYRLQTGTWMSID